MAVAYMRLSKDDGLYGIEAQRAAIEAWAAREGVCVTAWCVDENVSGGAPPEKRKALQEAFRALERAPGTMLVVGRRDRIARDLRVTLSVEATVKGCGGRIVSADGSCNDEGPEGDLMRAILDSMAQYERELIRSRTRAALARAKAAGKHIGAVAVEVSRPEVVEKIKEMRALGLGYKAIAQQLNLEGVAPPRGRRAQSREWYPNAVRRVLQRVGDTKPQC